MVETSPPRHETPTRALTLISVCAGLVAFCALFLVIDQTFYQFISSVFPPVGESASLATAWGILSRAPWVLALFLVSLLKPGLLALQAGQIRARLRFVVAMVAINCIVVATFLVLSGSSTPYSGNQWTSTEVLTVPLVEELFWRGLVFSILFAILIKSFSRRSSLILTVWLGGVAFGVLHAANALAGVPLQFVAVQTLNAMVWGVVYSHSRAITDSVYPSVISHAAMNLVVIAF